MAVNYVSIKVYCLVMRWGPLVACAVYVIALQGKIKGVYVNTNVDIKVMTKTICMS